MVGNIYDIEFSESGRFTTMLMLPDTYLARNVNHAAVLTAYRDQQNRAPWVDAAVAKVQENKPDFDAADPGRGADMVAKLERAGRRGPVALRRTATSMKATVLSEAALAGELLRAALADTVAPPVGLGEVGSHGGDAEAVAAALSSGAANGYVDKDLRNRFTHSVFAAAFIEQVVDQTVERLAPEHGLGTHDGPGNGFGD